MQSVKIMEFTLNYWLDDGWYVGQLKDIPSIVSQGETLEDLKVNIKNILKGYRFW